jgi:hypothetical protein
VTTVYVPGTSEKDSTKIVMSLQANAAQNTTNATNIATNTTNIATNTTNIATNTTNIATNTTNITALQNILSNVVQTVDTTNRSTSSTSFVASGVQVSITPASTSNKVLITVSGIMGASAAAGGFVTLYRSIGGGADTALTPSGVAEFGGYVITSDAYTENCSFTFLDSPATTSATIYKLYFRGNGSTIYLGRRGVDTLFDSPTIMTAQEVRG